jgi:hypothetical protein
MKNFESPMMFSVPGFTASHDSEWFEFSICGPHVPGSGFVEPGGTGYPPPATGLLATTFVPTMLHDVDADPALASTPSATSAKRTFFTISPPLLIEPEGWQIGNRFAAGVGFGGLAAGFRSFAWPSTAHRLARHDHAGKGRRLAQADIPSLLDSAACR